MNTSQDLKKDLEEKIFAKRQQIEFEKTNLDLATEFSQENRENPEVMEETKNFDDPAESVVETDELNSLQTAEKDLNDLVKQLEELNKR
ncbi:hypothetical protein [Dyadobacter fanqingshengii]|uniref:Uncharacterized protein n=1 Tax=Dyadobacter fanqingshengii TaxID=2906443 RepID=A0A9X1T9F2_9BACT|nr:hypothetical protein [Dyadobacter fanqingshengii]MCF0040656.1 hypothetical protein [Dyadobacter fanqingshengii]MCF2501742.1 hypothetical protein [Dyadobacter fanqingshengii]USJ37606.1 hypothetical protein NFI81_07445 [Dyadobacter fanqingshengii]